MDSLPSELVTKIACLLDMESILDAAKVFDCFSDVLSEIDNSCGMHSVALRLGTEMATLYGEYA